MRLWILLGSIGVLLQTIGAQRSWWPDRPRRQSQRLRRYRNSSGGGLHRRRSRRPYSYDDSYDSYDASRDSYEDDSLVISSSELSRRVNKFERPNRPRAHRQDYYPNHQYSNQSHSTLLESTPEYKIETRNGDTIIEFARSGETQGKLSSDRLTACHVTSMLSSD